MEQKLYKLPQVSQNINNAVEKCRVKQGYLEALLIKYFPEQPILMGPIGNAPKGTESYSAWAVLSIIRKLYKQARISKKTIPVVTMETVKNFKENSENSSLRLRRFKTENPYLIGSFLCFWDNCPLPAKTWLLYLPGHMLHHIEEEGEKYLFRKSSLMQ